MSPIILNQNVFNYSEFVLPWIKGRVFCSLGATDADWEYFIKQFRIAKDSPLQGSDFLNLLLLLILDEQSISEDGFEYFNNTNPENERKHNSYSFYFYTKSSKSVSIKNRDASIKNQSLKGIFKSEKIQQSINNSKEMK